MRRSLSFFWRMNAAVVAGVAITTAVLTGALLVGDSLRGSLEALTLDRLGTIDLALSNPRFFPAQLGERLLEAPLLEEAPTAVVPAILLRGTAIDAQTDLRASGVQIIGTDPLFEQLYADTSEISHLDFSRETGQVFPSVIVNQALASELDLSPGDDLLLSLGKPTTVPKASLLGRRDESDVLTTQRATVTAILPSEGAGRFSLEARQNQPLNLFIELSTLQRRLDRRDQVNLLLLGRRPGSKDESLPIEAVDQALADRLQLDDLGLEVTREGGALSIESAELVLRPQMAEALADVESRAGIASWSYLTYLANVMRVGERVLPYSTVAALETPIPAGIGALVDADGMPFREIAPGEILLSGWAASDLEAEVGDRLALSYYKVDRNDELSTAEATFTVGGIASMRSLATDPTLTPDVPGVSDAADMAGWDPPFPVDLDLVRPRDEAYWDEYRGAPKAFVDLGAGQKLWRSRYGELTAVRWIPSSTADLDLLEATVRRELPRALKPAAVGFEWLPVRTQGLRAASGTTDFAGLFVGFSLFLIVSSALLVSLLFTLLVEQRGREAGLLLAIGFPVKRVRRRFLFEGGVLAILGVILGTGMALIYTDLILAGLAVWWSPILNQPILDLHVVPSTLVLGGFTAIVITLLVIGRSVRRLGALPARRLLAGSVSRPSTPRSRRRAPMVAGVALVLALALFLISLILGMESAPALFFGVGSALVISGIALFATWSQSRRAQSRLRPDWLIPRLAARNSSRNLARSLLSVSLVAAASFVLVSVSASRKTHGDVTRSRSSGTGGFSLVAEADTPLPAPLPEMMAAARSASDSGEAIGRDDVFSFRVLPGDDASCLNLYQPEQPRVLGVPSSLIDRGGFTFRSLEQQVDNPWTLLYTDLGEDVVPAFGDYNSVRWILHSGLGQEVVVENGLGRPVRLRLVGLLQTSIFQSELLIAENRFLELFPDNSGFAYFLGDVPGDDFDNARQDLEQALARFGLDVESAATRLAEFQAIENMYLATFEVLGGFGLLLGTVGLGIVLLRNTLERRGELAALRAFGYRRSTLGWMVVAENALLLTLGLLIGAGAGLIAVAPYLWSGGIDVPWSSLTGILLAVFGVGLLASFAAVAASLRVPLLPALKSE